MSIIHRFDFTNSNYDAFRHVAEFLTPRELRIARSVSKDFREITRDELDYRKRENESKNKKIREIIAQLTTEYPVNNLEKTRALFQEARFLSLPLKKQQRFFLERGILPVDAYQLYQRVRGDKRLAAIFALVIAEKIKQESLHGLEDEDFTNVERLKLFFWGRRNVKLRAKIRLFDFLNIPEITPEKALVIAEAAKATPELKQLIFERNYITSTAFELLKDSKKEIVAPRFIEYHAIDPRLILLMVIYGLVSTLISGSIGTVIFYSLVSRNFPMAVILANVASASSALVLGSYFPPFSRWLFDFLDRNRLRHYTPDEPTSMDQVD